MQYILIDMFKTGLPYALLALGIFISYRVLDIADLSCEGSFTLGGALSAVLLVLGWNPFLATFMGMLAGFCAGAAAFPAATFHRMLQDSVHTPCGYG